MVGLKYGVNIVMGLYFCKINGCISEFDASFKVKKKKFKSINDAEVYFGVLQNNSQFC